MKKLQWIFALFSALALGVTSIEDSFGQVIVSYASPITIQQGAKGKLDVSIRSASRDADLLSVYSLDFLITPTSGTNLAFSNPQEHSHYSSPDYVFAGTGFYATSSSFVNPQRLVAGDGAFVLDSNGNPLLDPGGMEIPDLVLLSSEFDRLIVSLDFDATGVSPGEYRISLLNEGNTMFLDDSFLDELPIASASFSNFGIVTVTAVPEPGSILLASLGGLALIGYRKRRTSLRRA